MLKKLRYWWQVRTGEEETPFDGDMPAWVVSTFVHLLILVAIAVYTLAPLSKPKTLMLTSVSVEEEEIESEDLNPDKFEFSDVPVADTGSDSLDETDMAMSIAPVLSDVSQVVSTDIPVTSFDGPAVDYSCLLYTSPSPRDATLSRMPSSA